MQGRRRRVRKRWGEGVKRKKIRRERRRKMRRRRREGKEKERWGEIP